MGFLDALRRAARYLVWAVLFSALAALAVFVRSSALDPVYVSEVSLQAVPGEPRSTRAGLLGVAAADAVGGGAHSAVVRGERLVIEVTASAGDEAAKRATALAAEVSDAAVRRSTSRLETAIELRRQVVTDTEAALPAATPEARPGLELALASATQELLELESTPPDRLELAAAPTTPRSPIAPTPARDAAAAFAVVLAATAFAAVVVAARSDRFLRGRLGADIAHLTDAPLLAVVAGDEEQRQEAVAAVRGALLLLPDVDRLRTLAITTPDAGVAATSLTWALAESVSALGASVVAVDANLREPRLHELAAGQRDPGFAELLRDEVTVGEVLQGVEPRFVGAGGEVGDPMSLLTAGSLRPVLESVEGELVVVDLPVALRYGDAVAVAPAADATLVVIDPRRTRRRDLADLVRQLRLVGAHVAGVVAVVPAN